MLKFFFITLIASICTYSEADNLSQEIFEEIICAGKDGYLDAGNEVIANQVDKDNKSKLSNFFSNTMYVKDWNGKLLDISSTMSGFHVSIGIGCRIRLQTWNNALSDIYSNTLIPDTGELADSLAKINLYDSVTFSGYFVRSALDVVEEQSLTQRGRILKPEFSFIFGELNSPSQAN